MPSSLHDLTATEALDGLRKGAFSAEELARDLLRRAERYGELNAFVSLDGAEVLRQAREADAARRHGRDAALLGLPVTFKDNIDIAGTVTTAGTNALRDNVARQTAPVAAALVEAGAVVFGKANLHELAFGCTSNNAAFGPARNPYDPDRVPGGSSGGTAVAVGGRLVPAGLGTDTGGSIRIPAALCGIVGFRPSIGLYSQDGIVPIAHTRDTPGPMARSVADAALIHDAVLRRAPARAPAVDLAGLRIGVPRTYFFERLERGVATVSEEVLARFAGYGIDLIEADIPDLETVHKAGNFPVILHEALVDLAAYLAACGGTVDVRAVVADVASPDVREIVEPLLGAGAIPAHVYREALAVHRPHLQRIYADYFSRHRLDALVYPTTPVLPVPIEQEQSGLLKGGDTVPAITLFDRNVSPASNAGIPSLSMPAGLSAEGLPVGFTLDAPAGADDALLALGRALEAVEPAMPPPPLSSDSRG